MPSPVILRAAGASAVNFAIAASMSSGVPPHHRLRDRGAHDLSEPGILESAVSGGPKRECDRALVLTARALVDGKLHDDAARLRRGRPSQPGGLRGSQGAHRNAKCLNWSTLTRAHVLRQNTWCGPVAEAQGVG